MEQAGPSASRSASVRFLAFCGEPSLLRQWLLSLVPSPDCPERLDRILNCANLVVYASPETPFVRLEAEKGLVVGGAAAPPPCREAPARHAILRAISSDPASDGMPDGGYVAFVRAGAGIAVFRGAPGAVEVYCSQLKGVAAFFSDTGLMRELGPAASDIRIVQAGIFYRFSEAKLQDNPR